MPTKPVTDHSGEAFNFLTGIRFHGKRGKVYYWKWKCACGKEKVIATGLVVAGTTKSCGCMRSELQKKIHTRHGQSMCRTLGKSRGGSIEYKSWGSMKSRVLNKRDKDYPNYGGRGIKICDRWINSFENFLKDMGKRPNSKYTLHRKDNDGDYCPENCEWATPRIQSSETRRTRKISFNGETMCLAHWAEKIGCSRQALRHRINKGWPIESALTMKFKHSNRVC